MVKHTIFISLVLFIVARTAVAFLQKGHRRISTRSKSVSEDETGTTDRLVFDGPLLPSELTVNIQSSFVLECVAGGPSPSIHWLKDEKRIPQGHHHRQEEVTFDDTLSPDGLPLFRAATIGSRLYVNCVSPHHEGLYACVAETPYSRISQTTRIVVNNAKFDEPVSEGCNLRTSLRGEPARITQWTMSLVEYEGATVVLRCRAEGTPAPTIIWFDKDGFKITENSSQYLVTKSGDLIIKDVNWADNMGTYNCSAENEFGKDVERSFLYPMGRGK